MADEARVLDRAGGIVAPGATSGNDSLSGTASPETFYLSGASTGKDTITNFGKNDLLVVDYKIFDSNNDGIVNFGKNGVLDLDGPDKGKDTVTFVGENGPTAMRYLGVDKANHYVYADAAVRLEGFKEGKIGVADTFTGTANADVFFFDTDLDVAWGKDVIKLFGLNDKLVTTSAIFDGDHNNIIEFNKNGLLDLSGSDDLGHAGQQNQESQWGQVKITDTAGSAVTALHFDGSETINGVTYYHYGLIADA